ncbi:MAG: helix-turn-helix domain-containing protein [Synergistaceae bacterium]|nr:helix-turn-helix domain-containing protein [Synergistaceae bacterium]
MDIAGYIGTTEAARLMKLDPSQVCRLCRDGRLEGATRIGREWLIPRSSAEGYTPGPQGFAAHPENIRPRRPRRERGRPPA